jgi:hypothetical protein
MASEFSLGTITSVGAAIGIAATGGKTLPPGGKSAAATAVFPAGSGLPPSSKTTAVSAPPPPTIGQASAPAANDASANAKSAASSPSDAQALADQVNKFLNETGRSDQFRVDPSSANYIQQINPSTGAVIGEYLASEFPALARSIGASGLLIDYTA